MSELPEPTFQHAPMSADELQAFIDAHEWRFAKTMPQWPHWYVVKKNCRDAHEFERFVMHVRRAGYIAVFRPFPEHRGFKRHYLDVGAHHYWTQGDPLANTWILNRAEHPNIAEKA